ncbi:MAG: hypothetical protein KDK54_16605 [Leptospiraceae bacterium]|nr:hypothetical protein [Leptospiraceae bacterium]
MNQNELLYLIAGFLGGFFVRHFLHEFLAEEELILPEQTPEEKAEAGPIKTGAEIGLKKVFNASRLGDPITPDEVIFDTKGITFNVRELFSNTESFVLYSDISGVEIVESIMLATIKVKPKIRAEIKIDNFTKSDAKLIKKYILERLQ